MSYLGQRVQIDVKIIPRGCIVGDAKTRKKFTNILLLMNTPDTDILKPLKNIALTHLRNF